MTPPEGVVHQAGAVHHVELYVSDLVASLAIWSWLLTELGYESYQVWEGGRSYKLGPSYIVFVATEHKDPAYDRRRVGLNHIAFHARSRAQVDSLTEGTKAKGMRVLYEDRHPFAGGPDHYALYFEDPDGIKVEVVAPRA